MPDIPITSPLEYLGVILLLIGVILILAGIKIIKIEKVTINPGRKTWVSGLLLLCLGLVFLVPNVISSTQKLSPTPTLTSTVTENPTTITTQSSPTNTQISIETPILNNTPLSTNFLFFDDFQSNSNNWAIGEGIQGDLSTQSRSIDNGVYALEVNFENKPFSSTFAWTNVPQFRAKDFIITLDTQLVQFSPNSDVSIVIAFRYANQGENTYVVSFSNRNIVSFYSKVNGNWKLIHEAESKAFQLNEGLQNKFSVKAFGQRFTIIANDTEIYSLTDETFSNQGEIGIGVAGQPSKYVILQFDNLFITDVEP